MQEMAANPALLAFTAFGGQGADGDEDEDDDMV